MCLCVRCMLAKAVLSDKAQLSFISSEYILSALSLSSTPITTQSEVAGSLAEESVN